MIKSGLELFFRNSPSPFRVAAAQCKDFSPLIEWVLAGVPNNHWKVKLNFFRTFSEWVSLYYFNVAKQSAEHIISNKRWSGIIIPHTRYYNSHSIINCGLKFSCLLLKLSLILTALDYKPQWKIGYIQATAYNGAHMICFLILWYEFIYTSALLWFEIVYIWWTPKSVSLKKDSVWV